MFKRIDRSAALSRLFDRISEGFARQRGLTVVIGIVLVLVSFLVQVINVAAASPLLDLIGVITLHVGVLTALIGLLVINPLG